MTESTVTTLALDMVYLGECLFKREDLGLSRTDTARLACLYFTEVERLRERLLGKKSITDK